MGLEGTDLLNFVHEQQKLEREERDKERERQREEKALEEQRKKRERVLEKEEKEQEAAEKKEKQRKEKEKAFIRKEAEIKLQQAEEEAKARESQREFEKAKLAFEQKMEKAKLTSAQRQEEERERHRSDLGKLERRMQSRESEYLFPPPQVQFSVSHRETGGEAADCRCQRKPRRWLMLVELVLTKLVSSRSDEATERLPRCRISMRSATLWTAT